MRKQEFSRTVRSVIGLALAGLTGLGLVSCGNKTDNKVANHRPSVRLTGGPAEGDSVTYTTEFLWTGWDDDGIIDHYQYAIDVPDDLIDEIDNPNPTGIAWIDTTTFRASFLFTTTVQDSSLGIPIEQFRGDHTFYVRAIDNEQAVSDADYLTFTARTVTPKTIFTIPKQVSGVDVLAVGRQFNCAWTTVDPDNPDPARKAAYYEWKLKQMPKTWNTLGVDAQYAVDYWAADIPWIHLGADTASLRLSLQTGYPYIFVVRGVDEAGGVETRFFKGKNVVILDSSEANTGTPALTVCERTLGCIDFPGAEAIEFEVPLNQPLKFQFTATADAYGGEIQGYNYGLDVADDQVDTQFRGWSSNRFTENIVFTTPGRHTLTVKVRDTGGGVTVGTIILAAIPLTFDKEVLLVDDYRKFREYGATDAIMDERHTAMLEAGGYSRSDITLLNVFGPSDEQSDPTLPRLSDLASYKMVAWSVLGSALSRNCGLVACNACPTNRIVEAYVAGGGAFWAFGQFTIAGFKAVSVADCRANLNYGYLDTGNPSHSFSSGEFLYEFMKIDGGEFRDSKNQVNVHGIIKAVPTPRALAEGYPEMEVDRTMYTPTTQGIPYCDAMFSPVLDQTGGLDTLYTYTAMRSNSTFQNKPTGFRYHDPDPVPDQGPVAIFGFPTHLMQNGAATATENTGVLGTAKLLIPWLKQHQTIALAARRANP